MTASESAELERVRRIYAYLLLRDPRAADEMEAQAGELLARAAAVRAEFAKPAPADAEGPPTAVGGAGTRVQMALVGPDGEVKSTHDTGVLP